MRWNRQNIFGLRECVTAFTVCCLISDERRDTLRDAIISMCVGLQPLGSSPCIVRTDPAPGFAALRKDKTLSSHGIELDIGQVKNRNKNPVAEKAVRELEEELLKRDPSGGQVSRVSLSVASAVLNCRVRGSGLSAREMWTQRDQFTGCKSPQMTEIL
jgi:hypothetical protein